MQITNSTRITYTYSIYICITQYTWHSSANLRYELEAVVAELVVGAVEEPLGDAPEGSVLLDQGLYICDII